MSKLYVMMGLPGVGKSYWCKQNVPKEAKYISRDEIRFSMLTEQDAYFSKEVAVYNEFIYQINQALKDGYDVYADQTSLTKKARAKLIHALNNQPEEINIIYLKKSLDTILLQNAERTGRSLVPEDVVIRMSMQLEEPTADEGFSNITIIREEV